MRQIILFALVAFALVSCGEKKKTTTDKPVETPKSSVTITGTVTNPVGEEVIFVPNVALGEVKTRYTAKLNEDGTFNITFPVSEGTYFTFKHGEYSTLYLAPNNKLALTVDTENFDESITYSGEGSAVNNYMKDKILSSAASFEDLYSMSKEDFLNKVNEIKDNHLATVATTGNKTFTTLEKENILYEWATKLQNYPDAHEYFTKNEVEAFDAALTSNLNPNKPELLSIESYRNYIDNYASLKAGEETDFAKTYTAIGEWFSNEYVTKYMKVKRLRDYIMYESVEGLDGIMANLKTDINNDVLEGLVTKEYDNWKLLAKGNTAPEFVVKNEADKEVKLSDLKGKYVYVDVWATWCGPCKREMPHYAKLSKKYGDKITFMTVSIDEAKDADKWKKMVGEKDINGLKTMAVNDWDSDIANNYNINGIPRFMLIDPEGNIVTARAPRPSSDEIAETLNELI